VEQTRKEGEKLTSLSHDELRNQTFQVQETINNRLKNIDDQLAALHKQVEDNPELGIEEKESIFAQIDKLEIDRNKELEKVLMEVLPKAFAIVVKPLNGLKKMNTSKLLLLILIANFLVAMRM
jgi:preprotein translocase subunit SecA